MCVPTGENCPLTDIYVDDNAPSPLGNYAQIGSDDDVK
jgi:hypothetical protein